MKKRLSIRLLSYLIICILALSAPLSAYAEEVLPISPDESTQDVTELPADPQTYPDALPAPDENVTILQGEDGEFYALEIEDEDPLESGDLLEEAKNELCYEEGATDLEILEAAYELVLDLLPADTGRKEAAAFLSDLLGSIPLDQALITGTDEAGSETAWVIVRITPENPYYILDPAADLNRTAEEWTSFLLGADAFNGWTADEEFLTVEWAEAHPLSPESYVEPEEPGDEEEEIPEDTEAEPEDTEAEPADDPEEDAAEETEDASLEEPEEEEPEAIESEEEVKEDTKSTAETEDAEKEEAVKESSEKEEETLPAAVEEEETASVRAADAGTVVSSGTCGAFATWEISQVYNSSTYSYVYTLTIGGRGDMNDYSSYSSTPWYNYSGSINKVIIGKYITSIGSHAFQYFNSLSSIQFNGTNVSFIGDYAFYNCSSLTRASIPSGVRAIGSYAFAYCYNLEKAYFPSTLTTVGNYAFYSCSSLSSVKIPASVITLGSSSFSSLSDVYYPSSSTRWQNIGGPNAIGYYTTVHYTKSITGASVSLSKSVTYTGKARKPLPTVKLGSKTLRKGTDYTLSYSKNVNVGTAKVTIKGKGSYDGSITRSFKITKRWIKKNVKVTGVKNMPYNGKARKLSSLKVKVKIGSSWKTLKAGRDYTVKYTNNKKISTSKSKAKVSITGKGNYAGTIARSFKIVKASPGLKFASSKFTRTANAGSFTRKATKKASGSLTMTYKSSKTAVASVNSKSGKVTPKKVGTTKITVKSRATSKYRAGSASYKLILRYLKPSELRLSFSNYTISYIPLSTFRLFYSSTEASTLYNKHSDLGKRGVCYGISAMSMMLNTSGSGMKPSYFDSSAKHPEDLSQYDYYKTSGTRLDQLVEAMFVSQLSDKAQSFKRNHKDKINSLVSVVKKGKPVLVEIYDGYGAGHAMVAYKVEGISSTTAYLYVYDCNDPYTTRYIRLYKYSSGSYYGWSYTHPDYDYWSYSHGWITYATAGEYKSMWNNRKGSKSALSSMFVAAKDFEIRDAEGNVVAQMTDGEFSSSSDEIFLFQGADIELDSTLLYLPSGGTYEVVNTSEDETGLDITLLDNDQSISVTTETDSIRLEVDSDNSINKAVIDAEKGQSFEVQTLAEDAETGELNEITFTGEGTGQEVTLGTEEGACVINNSEKVTLAFNGEEVAYVAADDGAVIEKR